MYGMFHEYTGQLFQVYHNPAPDPALQIGKAKMQTAHAVHAPWLPPCDGKLDLPQLQDNYEQPVEAQTDRLTEV